MDAFLMVAQHAGGTDKQHRLDAPQVRFSSQWQS